MNMKNANVEFVSFDAQDVIATSSATAYFQLNGSLVEGSLSDYDYWDDGFWHGPDNNFWLGLYSGSTPPLSNLADDNDYKYFVLTKESYSQGSISYDEGSLMLFNVILSDEKPASGEYYATLAGILGWLATNGAQQ